MDFLTTLRDPDASAEDKVLALQRVREALKTFREQVDYEHHRELWMSLHEAAQHICDAEIIAESDIDEAEDRRMSPWKRMK